MDNSVDQGKDLLRSITGQLGETWQVWEFHAIPSKSAPIPPLWIRINLGAQIFDLSEVTKVKCYIYPQVKVMQDIVFVN